MKSTKKMPIWRILMQWEIILFFMLVTVIVVFSSLSPYFLDFIIIVFERNGLSY